VVRVSYRDLLGQAARASQTDADVAKAIAEATAIVAGNGDTVITDEAGDEWPSDAVCEIAAASLRRAARGW
jgi:hypothetical protein